MAQISSLPNSGPAIPAGATKVSIKEIDTASATKPVDVTVLEDEERKYAAPPLVDGGTANPTMTCSVSGIKTTGTTLAITDPTTKTGWICTDHEVVYEVGKHVLFSANFVYFPDND